MYGTVARVRIKPGHLEDILSLFEEWDRDFAPRIDGAVGGLLYRLDASPEDLVLCAVFRDRESYRANADNPEQDKWYQRFREHLTADPIWSDGDVVRSSLGE